MNVCRYTIIKLEKSWWFNYWGTRSYV